MTTTTRTAECQAKGGPTNCTDPNCPEKRAGFQNFLQRFAPDMADALNPARRAKKNEPKPPRINRKANLTTARGAFQSQVAYWTNLQTTNDPAYDPAVHKEINRGLQIIDKLDKLGATTGKDEILPTASLTDARVALQHQVDYWQTRMFYGDPLFDQWMVDALDESKKGVKILDKLENLGVPTGKADVPSTTPTHYTTIDIKLEKSYDGYSPIYTMDGGTKMSTTGFDGTKEEAYQAAEDYFRKTNTDKINDHTIFIRH